MGQFKSMGQTGSAIRAVVIAVTLALVSASGAAADTFYVNSTSDTLSGVNHCPQVTAADTDPTGPDGACTLPDAITAATNAGGQNEIQFIVCGPFVITSQLPDIPGGTTIDAGGVGLLGCYDADSPDSVNYGYAHLAGQGAAAGTAASFPGLVLTGSGSTVTGGIILSGFTNAIELAGTGDHTVVGDGIGASPFEQGILQPENTGDGVLVEPGSAGDVIGSEADLAGDNEFSQDDIYGNGGWGIELAAGSGPTQIGHNFIGTDTSGHLQDPGSQGYGSGGVDSFPGNGPSDGNGLGGIDVEDSSGDVIGGLTDCNYWYQVCNTNVIANNGGPGVVIASGAGNARVEGNDIGLSLNFYIQPETVSPYCQANGDDACPGANHGPGVLDAGSGDVIGGTATGAGNQISGNAGPGVELAGDHGSVADNLIGQDIAGTAATPNIGAGVLATDAGGDTNGLNRITGNVIGGNTGAGVELDQSNNAVSTNVIGVAGDRSSPLPNASGVYVTRSTQTIGSAAAAPNTIAHNTGNGITVVTPQGASAPTSGVHIYRNSIFDNGKLGIDLGDDGVTTVPAGGGPTSTQAFPVLTSASAVGGNYRVKGTLDSLSDTYEGIYLYASPQCDPSGYGQGQTYVNGGDLSTDASGHANFTLSGTGLEPGDVLTATADGYSGSEFSRCITVTGGADIAVTQTVAGGGTVVSDEPADIDIHVANQGTTDATGLTLTDTISPDATLVSQPAGCPAPSGQTFTCGIGDLAAGASEDIHVLLKPDPAVQTLTNSVDVEADQLQSVSGANVSPFATAVSANPNEPVTGSGPIASPPPSPTFGEYLRLDRESGTVLVTLPNGQRIDLNDFAIVPVGTIVQAQNGVVQVSAELPGSEPADYAQFKYGSFQIEQSSTGNGDVNAVMNGSLSGCTAKQLSTKPKKRTGTKNSTAPRGKVVTARINSTGPTRRRLWGHDHGHFTITGNRGAATVKGTIWQVSDTCTTTTVNVYQDSVSVVGFGDTVPHKATVTAGHKVVLHAPAP